MNTILLLGDSISLGYRDIVKVLLKDKCEVIFPPENGRFVAYTFRALYEWSRDLHWTKDVDVVYWNNGLWDVVRIFGDEPQTPLDDYAILIGRTYDRLKYLFPKAEIIFATTTAVAEARFDKNIFCRSNNDIARYNKAATQIIIDKGGNVHDLYSVTKNWSEEAYADSTHFVANANTALGVLIAKVLTTFIEQLGRKNDIA